MTKFQRILFVCLLAVFAGPVLAAGTAPSAKDPVTLRLWAGAWGIPVKGSTSPWDRATRAVFDRFKQLHPEIKIESASGIQVQGPASESGLLMAMAGGTAPDVFYVNFRKLESYVPQNFLYPLDEYIKKDPEVMERVHPEIRKVITINDQVYCVPFFQCTMALYYRKDLFREAGLDPNRPPQNWDEFYQYAQKMTDPDKGKWGFGFYSTKQGRAWFWTNFLWQAGAEVVEKQPDGKIKAVFNSPEGVTALRYYKKLVSDPWVKNGKTVKGVSEVSTTLGDDINRGKIGMWFTYTMDLVTNQSDMNPSLIGIAPLPAGPTGIRANEINAGMWGMNSQIKDKRKRDAAWEYIKFVTGPEADRIRTKAYVEAGLWKFVNPKHLKEFGYEEYISSIPKEWIEANVEAFKHGKPEPHGPNLEMVYNEMDVPLQTVEQYPNANLKHTLDAAVYRINTTMLGYRPAGEMKKKRAEAWVMILVMLVLVAGVGARQVRLLAKAQAPDAAAVAGRKSFRVHMIAWLFMAPAVISIIVWMYYPLLRGMVMAFQDYTILGGSHFVGLDNFIEALGQKTFWYGMINSFIYAGYSLTLGFFAPIFLALMLAEVPRGKMLFRTLYYLPAVTSGLVIMFLWKWFYDPTPQGLFNTMLAFMHPVLQYLHIPENLTYLQDPKLAMLCVIIPTIWAGAGPGSLIYLAALKSIPDDMYEAADVDGAGVFTKIFRIVLPTLKPLLVINFVGAFIASFKAMENVFVMTGGDPLYRTHTIGLEIWYNAFMYLKFGYATAAAWMMGSILIGFTVYQLKILRDVKFSSTGREDN